ncbi:MAG: flavodoxin [bacterium]|nr:flavodoxin [bacterium]
MKKTISLLLSATVMIGSAVNALAVSDSFYSTDTETITREVRQMTDTELEEFINENIDIRLQDMSTLVTLTANQEYDKIDAAVQKSVNDGLTAVEIKEAIYQSAPYCGYTRAIKAMDRADTALSSLGVNLPTESRITSSEETRYTDGLAVQRHIFGPQIGTITNDMTAQQKLQTLYLSGICFGDFYNRAGLSLNTREFLTFSTIAANGTCISQVGSHTTGNLNVGHSKDILRAALLANEEYNGEEKTMQALAAVNANESEPAEGVVEPASAEPIDIDYTNDSQELADTMIHYQTDDADMYIDTNLDAQMQKIIIDAVNAYIDGTAAVTSDNERAQNIVDLMLLGAEGGREAEVPAAVSKNLSSGNTADMMRAAVLLCTPYNGYPRTLNIMGAINSALETSKSEETVITMQIGNPVMTINGAEQSIDAEGTMPVVVDDRTLLPVRAFVEGIGGEVSWDNDTQTATLVYNGTEIRLTIGSTTAYLDNEVKMLDVTPVIINDRTMLPIRFIAESFEFDVDWNDTEQRVTITKAAAVTEPTSEPTAKPEETPTPEPTEEPSDTNNNEVEENKMLVVYFSGTGNTKALAETIAETSGADIFEIVPEVPYTSADLNYNDNNCRANREMNDETARPAIANSIENIDEYDTIFIGYPIWWGTMPRIINTFLDTYDLSGKTIMPFCTSGGSGISSSVSAIKSACSDSDVKDGMRGAASTSSTQVKEWIDKNIND